ncbi:MAG: UDP-N-acetylmuramoyl-tripeptide--D-alanyl-D-alanine ligase [Angustibacter sp.]
MIPLSLAQVASVVGGVVDAAAADVVVDGPVVTDARDSGPGSLYVARVGEHADGVDYVHQAAERGAVAVLATRVAPGLPTVLVPDVQQAFADLARGVLAQLGGLTVIGITGSSGKTSTKDLIDHVLAAHGPTVATERSFNGEVGVPLTVLRADRSTRYLVTEMGARGAGHIAYLTAIARPQVAVVLNVGSAHLGEFGTRAAIAAAKSELVQALPADGVAVLNVDDPLVRGMAASTTATVRWFGEGPEADVRAVDVRLDESARATFTVVSGHEQVEVRLALHGRHQVSNALAATAVALHLGITLPAVAAALSRAVPANRWRMEVTDRPDGVRVVNDAYNANPESMRAGLAALVGMARSGRTWAVLGEMLELGADSANEHERIGAAAVDLGVDRVVAVGSGARAVYAGAASQMDDVDGAVWVPDVDAAYKLLQVELEAGDVVLLKSSRDSGLRLLGDRLVADVVGSGVVGSGAVGSGAVGSGAVGLGAAGLETAR